MLNIIGVRSNTDHSQESWRRKQQQAQVQVGVSRKRERLVKALPKATFETSSYRCCWLSNVCLLAQVLVARQRLPLATTTGRTTLPHSGMIASVYVIIPRCVVALYAVTNSAIDAGASALVSGAGGLTVEPPVGLTRTADVYQAARVVTLTCEGCEYSFLGLCLAPAFRVQGCVLCTRRRTLMQTT